MHNEIINAGMIVKAQDSGSKSEIRNGNVELANRLSGLFIISFTSNY